MSHEVLYHCSHLEPPRAPLPPTYPSSFADFSPLSNLYFCEECDAIRCEQCVAVEVASYYCPNCLFDVPGANVRSDKNRCARSCFACPQCSTSLTALASEAGGSQIRSSTSGHNSGGGYFLICPSCKWTSKEINWVFDKPAGLAGQIPKVYDVLDKVQTEFDAIKDHLEGYISQSAPPQSSRRGHSRAPSRHIAQITQAATRALRREIPGMPMTVRSTVRRKGDQGDNKAGWDELRQYDSKGTTWRQVGLEQGMGEVDHMHDLAGEQVASLEQRWTSAYEPPRWSKATVPQRIPLQAKLTKRCPHPTCRHILIQPDTKTLRWLIKLVASNYLPEIEIGRRRRHVRQQEDVPMTEEEVEKQRKDRRKTRGLPQGPGEDEDMETPMRAGQVYTFQLAFTNPLYDPIQVRLATAHQSRGPVPPTQHVYIPNAHFTVGALKDVWAYDDEEDEHSGGDEDVASDDRGGHKGRSSMLSGSRHRGREAGLEKRGNVTKVGLEVEVVPGATGPIEFDLEVRCTYRAEAEEEDGVGGEVEFKTFTFWVRVCAGEVA